MEKRPTPGGDGRARLVAVAGRLFADHGFAATSMRRLATAAGRPSSAAYGPFASKEVLFAAVAEDGYAACLRDARHAVVAARSDSAVAQLDAVVTTLAAAALAGEPVLTLRFEIDLHRLAAAATTAAAAATTTAGAGQRRVELWSLVADIVGRGVSRGEMDVTEHPRHVASAIHGVIVAGRFAGLPRDVTTGTYVDICRRLVGAGAAIA